MTSTKKLLPLLILLSLSLSSCLIIDSARSTQVEIMKPGMYDIPKGLSVAVFKGYTCQFDTSAFKYFNAINNVTDTIISYHSLSDTCINALTNYFKEQDYFSKVTNYSDSLDFLFNSAEILENSHKIFEKTKSDVCIFLDLFHFDTFYYTRSGVPFNTHANLLWTILIKTEKLTHSYKQNDILTFNKEQINKIDNKNSVLEQLLYNSSKYLGNSFGGKLIPSWNLVERMFYRSKNHDMLMAEKYALGNDWNKAAELWKKKTENRNQQVAAKACFNMALASEMAGNPEIGIEWLIKSNNCNFKNNVEHKANCIRYIDVLNYRKSEITKLEKQIGVY